MLNFGASKPRVKGGARLLGPPRSTPDLDLHVSFMSLLLLIFVTNVSDICDFSNISDIAPLTLGSMEKSFFLPLILCHTGNLFE